MTTRQKQSRQFMQTRSTRRAALRTQRNSSKKDAAANRWSRRFGRFAGVAAAVLAVFAMPALVNAEVIKVQVVQKHVQQQPAEQASLEVTRVVQQKVIRVVHRHSAAQTVRQFVPQQTTMAAQPSAVVVLSSWQPVTLAGDHYAKLADEVPVAVFKVSAASGTATLANEHASFSMTTDPVIALAVNYGLQDQTTLARDGIALVKMTPANAKAVRNTFTGTRDVTKATNVQGAHTFDLSSRLRVGARA